ncbi:MAG: hypothetical protein O3A46_16355 [Candidatus Poribacteria bacterium]|nr:hypothetical protein [Candidatus Poribacteria bacterium]
MYDEPHRWLQAVENRTQYIERRLRAASPAIGLPYENGALLFTVCPHGQRKVYEVYDRLALAALGHPADVERLRMMAINLAHTEGFTRSADDVTLQRLLNFAIAPQVKASFDEVFRSPIIAKMLMVELTPNGAEPQFFTLNFDGNFTHRKRYGVAGGTSASEELMLKVLDDESPESTSLEDALKAAARTWCIGYYVATKEPEYDEPPMPKDADIAEMFREAREDLRFEAAVLDRTRSGRAKYRELTTEELSALDDLFPDNAAHRD